MTDSTTWHPLLEGEAAEKVWEVVFEIADALVENEAERAWTPTLTGGTGGISLFFSYLAQAREDEAFADTAVRFYEQMVETADSGFPFFPGLYSGIAGVGWTMEHLEGRLFSSDGEDGDEEDSNQPLDETLIESLREPWKGDYDLVSGLTGLGVYALERLPRRSALECLGGVLDRLADLAESGPEGTTWLSRPELLPEHQRELFPEGCHNLGMAHGVPGVIALLGVLSGIAPLRDRAVSLLQGAVSWLLARELRRSPSRVLPTSPSAASRPGSPGVMGTRGSRRPCSERPGIPATRSGSGKLSASPWRRRSGTPRARAPWTRDSAMAPPASVTSSTGCTRPQAAKSWRGRPGCGWSAR